jgi:hypothetical protein
MITPENIESVYEYLEAFREAIKDKSLDELMPADRTLAKDSAAMFVSGMTGFITKGKVEPREAILTSVMFGMFLAECGASQLVAGKPYTT